MGNDVSTIGGAVCTAATSVAAGVTFGQVSALNRSVVHCAEFTASCACNSFVRHGCETVVSVPATVACAVTAGICMGQVSALNKATSACAHNVITAGSKATTDIISTGDGLLNGTPLVGHVKGAVHYACGDRDGGDHAMKASSRTTGVIGGGLAGFFCGGPVGAVVGAVSAGAAMDGIVTGADSAIHGEFRPYGNVDAWNRLINDPNPQNRVAGAVGAMVLPASDIVAGIGIARTAAARLNVANIAEAEAVLASEVHPAILAEQQAAQAAGEAICTQPQGVGEAALAQRPAPAPPAAVPARIAAPLPPPSEAASCRSAFSAASATSGGAAASATPSSSSPSDYKSVIEVDRNVRQTHGYPQQLRPSTIAPHEVIGYRGVSKLELEALLDNGMQYDRVIGDGRNGAQLGRGIYCAEDLASAQFYAELPRSLPDGPGGVVAIRNGPQTLRGFSSHGLNGLQYKPLPCDFFTAELEANTRQIFIPEGVLQDLDLKAEILEICQPKVLNSSRGCVLQ